MNNHYLVDRSLEIYGNPNGIAAYSPELPYSATLGTPDRDGSQPQRGCVSLARDLNRRNVVALRDCYRGRNPCGVASNHRLVLGAAPLPRVAEYGNPGLRAATTSWLKKD